MESSLSSWWPKWAGGICNDFVKLIKFEESLLNNVSIERQYIEWILNKDPFNILGGTRVTLDPTGAGIVQARFGTDVGAKVFCMQVVAVSCSI